MRTYEQEIQAERDRFNFLVERDGLAVALQLAIRNRSIYRKSCLKIEKEGRMEYHGAGKSRDYRLMYARAARGLNIIIREHR
jgi:hypothetical protein